MSTEPSTPTDSSTPTPAPPGSDVHELARMIWNEQRSEGNAAMEAAAWIAVNRFRAGWAVTLVDVLSQGDDGTMPDQFQGYPGNLPPEDDVNWIEAQRIASDVLAADEADDPTDGAEYFGNGPGVEAAMREWDAVDPDFEWDTIEGTNFHYSRRDYTAPLPTPTPTP